MRASFNRQHAPRIISPLKNATYKLTEANKTIALTASAVGAVKKLYWFVDNSYVGESSVNNSLFWSPLQKGKVKILVVDDAGGSDSRVITFK